MSSRGASASKLALCALSLGLMALLQCSQAATAQQALISKLLVEGKISELPNGPLFWRIENFSTMAQAQAAAGPTGLVAAGAGKVWLFTLGPAGGALAGRNKVAEIGPLPNMVAGKHGRTPSQFLLRIDEVRGPPGSVTSVHTHPGSETFYTLAGETFQRAPSGVSRVPVGRSMAGRSADMPMQVSSGGSTDLHALAMFVLDAAKPFKSPARFY
jgi:hypothetical protein